MHRMPNLAVGSLLTTSKAVVDQVDCLVIVVLPVCQFSRCQLPTATFESTPSITITTATKIVKATAFIDPVP